MSADIAGVAMMAFCPTSTCVIKQLAETVFSTCPSMEHACMDDKEAHLLDTSSGSHFDDDLSCIFVEIAAIAT